METNILKALVNLRKNKEFKLNNIYTGSNKINNVGDALEYFVRDLFCDSLSVSSLTKKDRIHSRFISYLGNQNNPPDFIIKNSDAVEVKKVENVMARSIALNSSYPKSKLFRDDTRISSVCRKCDGGNWKEKDIIYTVGSVEKGQLRLLWFVYGNCYAADREVYLRVFNKLSREINNIEDVSFSKTAEVARVNRVDPLGITYFRIRGMWGISSPHQVFGSLTDYRTGMNFAAYCLMPENKYNSFPMRDREKLESLGVNIEDVEIKSPNNPARYLRAKLISITKS